jgi:hypothetical protein
MHDVEGACLDQVCHATARLRAVVQQDLERPAVADQRAREGRARADDAEPHDLETDPEGFHRRAQGCRWLAGQQRAAGDVVARGEMPQVMVGAHLVAAPRRNR